MSTTLNDWSQTRYAAALRQAERDQMTRTATVFTVTSEERDQLLGYVRHVARSGGYEALLHRIRRANPDSSPYGLTGYQWDLLDEALRYGVVALGRGGGPAAAALVDPHGLLDRVSVGQYRLTESGLRLMRGMG